MKDEAKTKERLIDELNELRKRIADSAVDSEKKQTEKSFYESEASFRAIVEKTPDAIVLSGKNNEIIFWNNGAKRIFGYDKEEVLGKPQEFLAPVRYRKQLKESKEKALTLDPSFSSTSTKESMGLKKDGREFPIEVSNFFWKRGDENILVGLSETSLNESRQRKN